MKKFEISQVAKSVPFDSSIANIPSNPDNVEDAILNHVARHNPDGPDAIATGTAVQLTPDLANSAGDANSVARSNHVHNIPTAAAVSLGANSTNTQGNATTFARSNHTHDMVTGVVIGQSPDQVNAEGAGNALARASHVHNIPTAIAVTISTNGVNAQGNAANFARSNHTHKSEIYYLNSQVTGTTTTTSAVDVLLDSMTLTPPAGTYHVYFQTSVQRNQNLGEAYFSCYVGGVKQTGSEVHFITGSGGSARDTKGVINIVGFPVVANGSQAIEIRWRQVGGADATSSPARSLTVVRVD